MGNICTAFLSWFPSHSQLGSKRKAAGCGFTLLWFHSQRSAGIPEFFPTTSAAHCSWSSTHKPTSDLHLMPNVPHFIIVTRATALQIVCQQQFVSVYSINLGRAEEDVRRGITAPRTPPLLTFIFPKPISQILTVRTAETISGYSPRSQVCHSKLPTYFANKHHVGSSIAIFTVSERFFFSLSTQKNCILFQSSYMPSFKLKLFWGYPSKQEKKTHIPQML